MTVGPPNEPTPPEEHAKAAAGKRDEISLTSAGQRRINLVWEYTQAFIAGTVVTTVLIVSAWQTILGPETLKLAAYGFLIGVANLVIGFYFGRTNHQRTGGVGANEAGR